MRKLSQSGAMAFICLLITILYYTFVQQDLINTTQILPNTCLDFPSRTPSLCITCVKRSDLSIASQSNIYVSDANHFKIVTIPNSEFLSCEELLQMVSYELPMETAADIKFQELGPTREIIQMLQMTISDPVTKFQVPKNVETIAVVQLKNNPNLQSTMITFSTEKSEQSARYYGQLLSSVVLILSFVYSLYLIFSKKTTKLLQVVINIVICLMVFVESKWTNQQYLLNYAIVLLIGVFCASSLTPRLFTIFSILIVIFSSYTSYESELLWMILVLFLVGYVFVGRGVSFQKIGTFCIFSLVLIVVCQIFRDHHHWLSLPLRKIIEYTVFCLTSLLIAIICRPESGQRYVAVDEGGPKSGVSLPGFGGEGSDEEDN